jgi:hypothetical protein
LDARGLHRTAILNGDKLAKKAPLCQAAYLEAKGRKKERQKTGGEGAPIVWLSAKHSVKDNNYK